MSAVFSAGTRDTLEACGLTTAEVDRLEKLALDLKRTAAARTPTRDQARAEALRLDGQAEKLARMLDKSDLAHQLPMVAKIVDGIDAADALDVVLLREQLQKLSDAAWALLAATGDDETRPQLDLRAPAASRGDATAAALASGLLWTLRMVGVPITTGERGAAVQCVAAVFTDAKIKADARNAVRSWLDRHPPTDGT